MVQTSISKIKNPFSYRLIEAISYFIIWITIFSVTYSYNRVFGIIVWDNVYNEWIMMCGFLIIFMLNVYWLVPSFLYKKKYFLYSFVTIIVITLSLFACKYFQQFAIPRQLTSMPPMEIGPGMPPMELTPQMPPPAGFKPTQEQVQHSSIVFYINQFIIAILIVAGSTSYKMISRWLYEERRRKQLEKEQLKSELALLRYQISPHFLMNTLNNIHALIDLNPENAKDSLIRLSTLMRYLLYETNNGKTQLSKEVDFISSYLQLMKQRYSSNVSINIQIPEQLPDVDIHPMLFISFIENAFKHGISYNQKSFVDFKIEIFENHLHCNVSNSIHRNPTLQKSKYSGIGMSNIKKTLELIYPNNHQLEFTDDGKIFAVYLSIPI